MPAADLTYLPIGRLCSTGVLACVPSLSIVNRRPSSRDEARRWVGQCLPLYPPFRASGQMGIRPVHHVSSSLSEIPYGGFSPVRLQAGRRWPPSPARAYRLTQVLPVLAHSSPEGNRRTVSALRRVPSGHSGPEALGSASSCVVSLRHRLLWPHPSFWPAPGDLWFSPAGLCLAAAGQKVPAFICESFSSCHFPYPGGPGGLKTIGLPPVIAFARMRGARRPRHST